ncbi:uncharacterized protein TM35_000371090 [Trypanosoma theileri]|uniref:Uncharacterized protein n=1 Tax=Trypanosoma theileri TaxID=67003 RepID=A0A1X0NKC6_9TRYP|nr:uncharacterized protein TM35_000371090 [Trypanosoma theileri]ORC85136.1 hypothetical protein TM35_000371090 [Trypanosoma theileri]
MHRVLLARNRVDFVATLLQQGRLADMLMLRHFTAPGTKVSLEELKEESSGTPVKETARHALLKKREAVYAKAMSVPNTAWMSAAATACGTKEECCALSQSRETVRATVNSSDPTRVTLNGTCFTAVEEKNLPASLRLAASCENGDAVMLTVPFAQSGERVQSYAVGGGLRAVQLCGAEGSIVADAAAVDEFTAEQNVLAAAACSGVLRRLEEICARHATNTARYDALLVRNPAVQKRLSQLASARFGVEALSSFVTGHDPAMVAADTNTNSTDSTVHHESEKYTPSLVESVALCMFAKHVLAEGVAHAREITRYTELTQKQPHNSKPECCIEYTYAAELFGCERQLLSSMGGGTAMQGMRYIAPLLTQQPHTQQEQGTNPFTNIPELITSYVLGAENSSVRLAAPHVNLQVSTARLEKDISLMLHRIRQHHKQHKTQRVDPLFVMAIAQYAAEVFANVAVVYRTTASLSREDPSGPRNWLLAQSFCSESNARRIRVLQEWDLSVSARRALSKAGNLDECTIHPVELMNVEPAKKKATTTTASTSTKTESKVKN